MDSQRTDPGGNQIMHSRTTRPAVAVLLLTAALAACSDSADTTASSPEATTAPAHKAASPKASPSVDCSDDNLSQADWIDHCSDKADGKSAGLTFGQTYTWDDGLKVTVVEARKFTDYDSEYGEEATPGATDFRVKIKLTNTGRTAVNLSDLSTLVDGATNGGEASSTSFMKGSAPLEGRLAPGVSTVKTDDNELESKYGKKVVITVQRVSDDLTLDFPEFNGAITG
ncbi:hypothetical protein [Streptomyces sp. NPDC008150]|uniref:hypothetical protein n=1 Tax=Streptomyces sp. NPDC008150 TaxID=3364816 RepID=UPI0036E83321